MIPEKFEGKVLVVNRPLWRELLVGGFWGIIGALLGNLILVSIGILVLMIQENAWEDLSSAEGIFFLLVHAVLPGVLICFGFSFIPGALGGMTLAGLVRYLAGKVSDVDLVGAMAGMLMGVAAAAVSAWLALRTVLWAPPDESRPYVVPSGILACIIAAAVGRLVGRKLSSRYRR
jgi:hypothetical protein